MRLKARNFHQILSSKYLPTDHPILIDSKKLFPSRYGQLFLEVYNNLGGKEEFPLITQKGYFFQTIKFAISFDDQLSFNRYRMKTLRSGLYSSFLGIKPEKYRNFCTKYERECLKSGTARDVWSNLESEHHFGKPELPGDLGLNGSTGWKYRALQEFLEDVYAQFSGVKLLRVSVWDEILINGKLHKIGDLLNTPNKETSGNLLKYLERRIINLFA